MTAMFWFLGGLTLGACLGLMVASILIAGRLADLEGMRE